MKPFSCDVCGYVVSLKRLSRAPYLVNAGHKDRRIQIEALGQHFHVLRYDCRGHGSSDVPAGPYSVDRLGRDAVESLDALKIGHAHFLGLSLGGMVGQWLGIHAPERIDRLILANTSAYLGPTINGRDALHPS